VMGQEIPQVDDTDRVRCRELGEGFCEVVANYGFMETPDVPSVLQSLKLDYGDGRQLRVEVMATSFYLGRETLIPHGALGMAVWRERLFALMSRNSTSAMAFFRLPPNRVVELGAQIEL